jgi:hypothetical protein
MQRLLSVILLLALLLAACGDAGNEAQTGGDQFGPFDWVRDADTIIVRLDSKPRSQQAPARELNSIPPCTVWGDGRVVWLTQDQHGNGQVLKARIDVPTMRSFLEGIFNRGFYSWESDIVPPDTTDLLIESVTVNMYGEVRTVEKYSYWPQNAYMKILDDCRALGNETTREVVPGAPGAPERGGWVQAYPVASNPDVPQNYWEWFNAPFSLHDLAASGEARWVEGALAAQIWLTVRESGEIHVIENDDAYKLAILVPKISRDAPPPPDDTVIAAD